MPEDRDFNPFQKRRKASTPDDLSIKNDGRHVKPREARTKRISCGSEKYWERDNKTKGLAVCVWGRRQVMESPFLRITRTVLKKRKEGGDHEDGFAGRGGGA